MTGPHGRGGQPGLQAAASRRHELARSKALKAVAEHERDRVTVTVASLAREAGVSRAWLYTQPDLATRITALRHLASPHPPDSTGPATDGHASRASLRARLEAATRNNRDLRDDNQRLRRELAAALDRERRHTCPTRTPGRAHTQT